MMMPIEYFSATLEKLTIVHYPPTTFGKGQLVPTYLHILVADKDTSETAAATPSGLFEFQETLLHCWKSELLRQTVVCVDHGAQNKPRNVTGKTHISSALLLP